MNILVIGSGQIAYDTVDELAGMGHEVVYNQLSFFAAADLIYLAIEPSCGVVALLNIIDVLAELVSQSMLLVIPSWFPEGTADQLGLHLERTRRDVDIEIICVEMGAIGSGPVVIGARDVELGMRLVPVYSSLQIACMITSCRGAERIVIPRSCSPSRIPANIGRQL